MNKDLTFIIPAAGKSSRFETIKTKIFFKYKNKFLIQHVLEKCLFFSRNIIIVSNTKNLSELKKIIISEYNNFDTIVHTMKAFR